MGLPAHRGGPRRVLMFAYFFPPLGGAGVQRAVKFAKYLPEFGWRPTVLTTSSTAYPAADPTLACDLHPGTRIVRARELEGAGTVVNLFATLGLTTASRIAAFPDAAAGWMPDALRLALRTARRERPAMLFSTSAPFSAHLIALVVHERTGIPWVADFRDEWSANPGLRGEPALVRRMARRLELEITSRASAITVVGDYFDIFNPHASPIAVIPNGVDDQDLEEPREGPAGDALTLSYVGTLYGKRDAVPVVNALQRLAGRGAIDLDQLRIRFVGNDWRPCTPPWPLPVHQLGYVSHTEALREMRAASVLLHYEDPANPGPGGKIYEYLASARPVLCVARPDGRAAALVRASGAGPIASPNDPEGIERAILELYERWRATGLPDQPQLRDWVLEHYSRRKLTGDLASVLDAAGERSSSCP